MKRFILPPFVLASAESIQGDLDMSPPLFEWMCSDKDKCSTDLTQDPGNPSKGDSMDDDFQVALVDKPICNGTNGTAGKECKKKEESLGVLGTIGAIFRYIWKMIVWIFYAMLIILAFGLCIYGCGKA